MARLLGIVVLSLFLSNSVFAAGPGFKPTGMVGSVGAGFATFKIYNPSTQFKIDQGMYATGVFEKGLNVFNLYLTLSLNYLTTKGQVYYEYATLSGETYRANDVNLRMDIFQAGMGLKFKIIDGFFFRPYVEAGGIGGWYTLKYENLKAQLDDYGGNPTTSNYKKDDSLLDFGQYAEAGVEVTFSESFGLRVAARLVTSETKGFETLKKQTVKYESQVYYLSVIKAF